MKGEIRTVGSVSLKINFHSFVVLLAFVYKDLDYVKELSKKENNTEIVKNHSNRDGLFIK